MHEKLDSYPPCSRLRRGPLGSGTADVGFSRYLLACQGLAGTRRGRFTAEIQAWVRFADGVEGEVDLWMSPGGESSPDGRIPRKNSLRSAK
jgi:hypothetical protein